MSGFFDILNMNNSISIRRKSKSLLGTSTETRVNRLMRKMGVKSLVRLSLEVKCVPKNKQRNVKPGVSALSIVKPC